MSDIIPQQNIVSGLTIKSIDDLSRLSVMLAKSGFFSDAKEAAQCGVKVLAGLELGFPTIASMCGIHIVNGKPTLGAHLMAAAVKRSSKYNYRVTRHDNEGCTIAFYENGEIIGESSFTRDDAAAAGAIDGKNAHTWKKYPRNMMFARAMSNGVRWYCPDIFAGPVYTPDELDLATDEEGNLAKSTPALPRVEKVDSAPLRPSNDADVASEPLKFSAPSDRNLLNLEIESMMKHKNISVNLARGILTELFNVKSRTFLTDEQLAQFLDYLKSGDAANDH